MSKLIVVTLALAGVLVPHSAAVAAFAGTALNYRPGTGYAPDLTDPTAALGAPSAITVDPVWGSSPVDPFSPPYLASQLVSLGAGGSLLVRFDTPLLDDPAHPFGMDLLIFGSTGFIITNGDYTGGGITDGSLFGDNAGGIARVSVSQDGLSFYQLNPSLTPVMDGLFPTDGSGDFQRPVNPALTGADFAGRNLAGIRTLYAGAAGGTGFDLAWAQDTNGQSVLLPSVSFVRVDVLSGRIEIDAFAAVPEPATWSLLGAALAVFAFFKRRR